MPASRGNARRQAGFTMIEVMVALAVTGIGTAGLVGLFMAETRASGVSRHDTEAAVLAQDKIESLRTSVAPATVATGNETGLDERGVVTGGLYTRSWTVTPVTGYDDVAVTVTWSENGTTRKVVMRSRRNL